MGDPRQKYANGYPKSASDILYYQTFVQFDYTYQETRYLPSGHFQVLRHVAPEIDSARLNSWTVRDKPQQDA